MEKWAEKIDIELGQKLIEAVPSMVYEKMKNSWAAPVLVLYESREAMYPISNKKKEIPVTSLKRKRAMSEDEDEEVPLREIYKKITRKKKIRSLKSIYEEEEKKKKDKLEEDEKNGKSIPVYELPFGNIGMDSGAESEEEVLCDGDRDEYDTYSGFKFLLNEKTKTFTRVKLPMKVYYRNCCDSVLHNEKYPVPTVTKLALDRYNAIEGTNYEYVGLVKAYAAFVGGYSYTVRFKACLPAQHPIYFQAMLWQETPDRDTHHILVNVPFVHPLPDRLMSL